MILTLAKRQFLLNIYSFRFIISLILCVVLFSASAVILSDDYSERLSQYNNDVISHKNELNDIYTYARLSMTIDRPPSPLSVFCQGSDKNMGTSVTVGFDRAPTIGEEAGTRNPLLVVFPQLDLASIIQMILSLLIILFSYNAVSGERENGTLRLIFSNGVSRHSFLLGNIIGGMASLLIPLFIGIISAVIILQFNPSLQFNFEDALIIGAIIVISIIYLSVFYALGLFLSSKLKRSAAALILLLFIWVIFLIIIPNSSVELAKLFQKVPDKSEIDNQASALRSEWQREMSQYVKQNPRPHHDYTLIRGRSVQQGDLPYAYMLWYAPREVAEWLYHGSIFGHNLRMEYEDRIWQLYQQYQNTLLSQVRLAKYISMLSPSWAFYNSITHFAATNEKIYVDFLDQAQIYRSELISYMKDKDGLSTYKLFSRKPPNEFLPYNELLRIKRSQGESAIEQIIGPGGGWGSVDPLDLSDIPVFSYNTPRLRDSLLGAFPSIGILLFLNILFFVIAWVSFLRTDIR